MSPQIIREALQNRSWMTPSMMGSCATPEQATEQGDLQVFQAL
jgi:hypothetical protein